MVLGKVGNQRGSGAFGCIFMLALLAAGMYAGFQFGLPRLRHSSFQDRVTEAFAGNFQNQTPEEVQKQIIQIASDFDIALTPAQVKVDTTNKMLKINVKYDKVIDLIVWQTTVPFTLNRSAAP